MLPETYDVGLLVAGLAVLGATILPRLLARRPLTLPVALVALGVIVFALPLGLDAPDPVGLHAPLVERLTELGMIIALFACGLKLDRPLGWRTWRSTWLLLGIAMPLTIVAAAALGWWAGLPAATAVLLGAVIAPTDPVLASDVQVGPPRQHASGCGEEDEVRFSLTAEAGLNDGLAFPFTNIAILMAVAGIAPSNWIGEWLMVDVAYRIVVGTLAGAAIGWAFSRLLFRTPVETHLAEALGGPAALAVTLISYAVTELVGGYGFIAVFVSALAIRNAEREHEYHEHLHDFAEEGERLLMAAILVGLGGSLMGGILSPLDWSLVLVGLVLVFLVRPGVGNLALRGNRSLSRPERWGMSFFGVRGIGSLYYLTHALEEASFPQAERLWALVVFVVVVSVIVHGLTATPLLARIDRSSGGATAPRQA